VAARERGPFGIVLGRRPDRAACARQPRPGGWHRIADEAWIEAAAVAGGEVCHDPSEDFEIEIEVDLVDLYF
jgi:hypothetical protein